MDRNYKERPGQKARPKSLSARRAWIEILLRGCYTWIDGLVALRKESVDRNSPGTNTILSTIVALRKESVDRNTLKGVLHMDRWRRSPQGERG